MASPRPVKSFVKRNGLLYTKNDGFITVSPEGSDVRGDGYTAPYQTLSRALKDIEGVRIAHNIGIIMGQLPGAQIVAWGDHVPTVFTPHMIDTGNLTIAGGVEKIVEGSYSVFSATHSSYDLGSTYISITASGGLGVDADDYRGKFLVFTLGSYIRQYYPIYSNDTDTVVIPTYGGYVVPAPGDTFDVVSPAVSLNLGNKRLVIAPTVERKFYPGSADVAHAALCLYNLTLDLSDVGTETPPLRFENPHDIYMAFVDILYDNPIA